MFKPGTHEREFKKLTCTRCSEAYFAKGTSKYCFSCRDIMIEKHKKDSKKLGSQG